MPDRLPEALDRFSQMFIAPLLNEYSIIREISAVNSEHEKNFASDSWRIRMVNKTLANPSHPYSHFSTGSTKTLIDHPKKLGLNIRQELVRFHRQWYKSGNLMTLSIMSNKSLDELETLVREYFINDIENKYCDVPYYDDKVFTIDQMMTKTFIEPTVDIRTMTLTFQTPDLREFYKSRVGQMEIIKFII
jgi:insulysin